MMHNNQLMLKMLNDVYEYNSNYPKKQLKGIINAMKLVDRGIFVPKEFGNSAYDDVPLPIGVGQTISQPSTVARMLLLLELKKAHDILEIGAGSGWNASLLAYLAYPGRVIAVERIDFLTNNAKKNIEKLKKHFPAVRSRLSRLTLKTEDALDKKSNIWKRKYDRIIITAGIERNDAKTNNLIQKMASQLLKEGGILICPLTLGPLQIYRKNKTLKKEETSEDYVFVPLLKGRI